MKTFIGLKIRFNSELVNHYNSILKINNYKGIKTKIIRNLVLKLSTIDI